MWYQKCPIFYFKKWQIMTFFFASQPFASYKRLTKFLCNSNQRRKTNPLLYRNLLKKLHEYWHYMWYCHYDKYRPTDTQKCATGAVQPFDFVFCRSITLLDFTCTQESLNHKVWQGASDVSYSHSWVILLPYVNTTQLAPSRHNTSNQCWFNVGPTSSTVYQR